MGRFGEMWIMNIKETDGTIESIVEYMEFRRNAYISWESANLPASEWIPKAEKTIYVKKDGFKLENTFAYPEKNITPIICGVGRKQTKYMIKTDLSGDAEMSLLHLVLPVLYIPESNTFSDPQPAFIKKQSERVAMTWSFQHHLSVSFRFRKVNPKEFYDYEAVGVPKTVKVDPKILGAVKKGAEIAEILTKMAVEFIK
jgi:hypothetical protein